MLHDIVGQLKILKDMIQDTPFYIDYKDQHKHNIIEAINTIIETVYIAFIKLKRDE